MSKILRVICALLMPVSPSFAQGKRLWMLKPGGEMVEYDPASFAVKHTIKVPAEAVQTPQNLDVNRLGQMLYVPAVSLPLSESDLQSPPKLWFWNGEQGNSIDLGIKHEKGTVGSNQSVTETVPSAYLSEDGTHLFWSANQQRRLQREEIDLSATTTWEAWQTDLTGGAREEITSVRFPECRCPTGACEESCHIGVVWAPDNGVGRFFLMTQFAAGKDEPSYKATMRYQQDAGKWTGNALPEAQRRTLDSNADGSVLVEAIPDTGCCGWSNQSNDQTLVLTNGKSQVVFDEQATYKNPDYDVSFFTSNARLSPDEKTIAMTITATAQADKPIQISEQGQANPEESKQIRKALADLPAIEVKSVDDPPRRIEFLPHASAVGWINDKELLIIENHVLVTYSPVTGARRKSTIQVADAARVFLR